MFWTFKENSYYALHGENGEFLGPKSTFLKFSQYLFNRFFWNCVSDTRHQKLGKSDSFGFYGKILIIYKMGEMGHFRAQNQHFWTLLQICLLGFSEITWWQALKSALKWLFWILLENTYCARYGRNKSFLGSKSTLLFRSYAGWQTLKSGPLIDFRLLKENWYYGLYGINGSSVRTRGSLWLHICCF